MPCDSLGENFNMPQRPKDYNSGGHETVDPEAPTVQHQVGSDTHVKTNTNLKDTEQPRLKTLQDIRAAQVFSFYLNKIFIFCTE